MSKSLKIILLSTLVSVLVMPGLFVSAEDLSTTCAALSSSDTGCPNMSSSDCRVLLQKCSDYYDQQSAQITQDLTKTTQQKNTLQNTINSLKNKIKNLDLQISQSNIVIKDLGLQIKDTETSIDKTALKIEDGKTRLAAILQETYEEDQRPLIEILISEGLSDFFDNLVALEALNAKNQELLINIKALKSYLEDQKLSLDEEKNGLEKQVAIQALQRQENASAKQEQDSLLKLTEAEYQKQLAEKNSVEKQAQAIRSRLFQLIGVPEAPTFEEALKIAKTVTSIVNIRPAFLLAVISHESAIGRNVGQCYLTDTNTGGGVKTSNNKKWPRITKPSRDVPIFLNIIQQLGRDPFKTPVSCWIRACAKLINGQLYTCSALVDDGGNIKCSKSGYEPYGWGGAMGPAQFIPSTWKLYSDKLQNILGKSGDPWAIKDSFTAAALYLYDLGASSKTSSKEKSSASRYYGGSLSYANDVMTRANCIQSFIDSGTMSSSCEELILPQ